MLLHNSSTLPHEAESKVYYDTFRSAVSHVGRDKAEWKHKTVNILQIHDVRQGDWSMRLILSEDAADQYDFVLHQRAEGSTDTIMCLSISDQSPCKLPVNMSCRMARVDPCMRFILMLNGRKYYVVEYNWIYEYLRAKDQTSVVVQFNHPELLKGVPAIEMRIKRGTDCEWYLDMLCVVVREPCDSVFEGVPANADNCKIRVVDARRQSACLEYCALPKMSPCVVAVMLRPTSPMECLHYWLRTLMFYFGNMPPRIHEKMWPLLVAVSPHVHDFFEQFASCKNPTIGEYLLMWYKKADAVYAEWTSLRNKPWLDCLDMHLLGGLMHDECSKDYYAEATALLNKECDEYVQLTHNGSQSVVVAMQDCVDYVTKYGNRAVDLANHTSCLPPWCILYDTRTNRPFEFPNIKPLCGEVMPTFWLMYSAPRFPAWCTRNPYIEVELEGKKQIAIVTHTDAAKGYDLISLNCPGTLAVILHENVRPACVHLKTVYGHRPSPLFMWTRTDNRTLRERLGEWLHALFPNRACAPARQASCNEKVAAASWNEKLECNFDIMAEWTDKSTPVDAMLFKEPENKDANLFDITTQKFEKGMYDTKGVKTQNVLVKPGVLAIDSDDDSYVVVVREQANAEQKAAVQDLESPFTERQGASIPNIQEVDSDRLIIMHPAAMLMQLRRIFLTLTRFPRIATSIDAIPGTGKVTFVGNKIPLEPMLEPPIIDRLDGYYFYSIAMNDLALDGVCYLVDGGFRILTRNGLQWITKWLDNRVFLRYAQLTALSGESARSIVSALNKFSYTNAKHKFDFITQKDSLRFDTGIIPMNDRSDVATIANDDFLGSATPIGTPLGMFMKTLDGWNRVFADNGMQYQVGSQNAFKPMNRNDPDESRLTLSAPLLDDWAAENAHEKSLGNGARVTLAPFVNMQSKQRNFTNFIVVDTPAKGWRILQHTTLVGLYVLAPITEIRAYVSGVLPEKIEQEAIDYLRTRTKLDTALDQVFDFRKFSTFTVNKAINFHAMRHENKQDRLIIRAIRFAKPQTTPLLIQGYYVGVPAGANDPLLENARNVSLRNYANYTNILPSLVIEVAKDPWENYPSADEYVAYRFKAKKDPSNVRIFVAKKEYEAHNRKQYYGAKENEKTHTVISTDLKTTEAIIQDETLQKTIEDANNTIGNDEFEFVEKLVDSRSVVKDYVEPFIRNDMKGYIDSDELRILQAIQAGTKTRFWILGPSKISPTKVRILACDTCTYWPEGRQSLDDGMKKLPAISDALKKGIDEVDLHDFLRLVETFYDFDDPNNQMYAAHLRQNERDENGVSYVDFWMGLINEVGIVQPRPQPQRAGNAMLTYHDIGYEDRINNILHSSVARGDPPVSLEISFGTWSVRTAGAALVFVREIMQRTYMMIVPPFTNLFSPQGTVLPTVTIDRPLDIVGQSSIQVPLSGQVIVKITRLDDKERTVTLLSSYSIPHTLALRRELTLRLQMQTKFSAEVYLLRTNAQSFSLVAVSMTTPPPV